MNPSTSGNHLKNSKIWQTWELRLLGGGWGYQQSLIYYVYGMEGHGFFFYFGID
jgi:hypothetical protein